MNNSPIPVLLCADRRYCQHMAVTIASLLKNNARHQFRLILVLDERDDEAESLIRRTVEPFHNAVIDVKAFSLNSFSCFRVSGHISLASYLRLFMTQFVDADIDKLLYLDCDLIVRDDIGDLWATDISQYFLAAVPDPYSDNHVQLGFREDEEYFNSGVLLVNLAKWRENDVLPRLIRYTEQNSQILRYHDQCTLNAVFRNQVLFLPFRWNFPARNADLPPTALGMTKQGFRHLRQNPSIVHYTGPFKPWLYSQEPHYKASYYEYLALTPWRGFKPADRSINTAMRKFLRMERLKEILKWRLPTLFRTVRRWVGVGDPFLRKLAG
jgi:lipopolysaccharide biosynthesis glycosyltransferase